MLKIVVATTIGHKITTKTFTKSGFLRHLIVTVRSFMVVNVTMKGRMQPKKIKIFLTGSFWYVYRALFVNSSVNKLTIY